MVFPLGAAIEGLKSLTTPFIQPLFVPLLYIMIQSLGTILSVWMNGDKIQDEKDMRRTVYPAAYDFIIAGAGSGGSLLANRLSRQYTVLLLEAGGEPNPLNFIPGLGLFLIGYPPIDWNHRTVPQKFGSLNSVNGESSWSTGLGLGGTGNINLMIHLRGHRKDFDNWARITGDPSWSWEGVLPYFKSYEEYEIPGDNINHGYVGDLRVEAPDYIGTAREFVKAGLELGYPNVDLNAPFDEGFDIIRYPIRRGVRQSPYKAFLEPARSRSSLTIMKFAHVNKILFREGNVAYGVEYDRHGGTYTALARREVIISSGTVGTPKILMLSGIGPKAHLESLNIPVVADLPVGENLQDHLGVYLGPFFIREGLTTFVDRDLTPSEFVKWFTLGRGRLTSTGCEATGIISSEFAKARGEGDWPDTHLFLYSITNFNLGPTLVSNGFNLKFDEIKKYFENTAGRDAVYVIVTGARPLARGYIKLGGRSPYDKPIIDPNYLGDEGDIDFKVLLEGVKKSVYLLENTTAGGILMGARFTTSRLPGCEHLPFRSDAYWGCFARRFSITLHHPAGTAAMGSVVDSQLRVKSIKNLRVVDASIQPVVVVTNTQASTLMIAEKASDMITSFWNKKLQSNAYKPERNQKSSFFGPIAQLLGISDDNNKGGYRKSVGGAGYIDDDNIYWKHKKRGLQVDRSPFTNYTTSKPISAKPLPPPKTQSTFSILTTTVPPRYLKEVRPAVKTQSRRNGDDEGHKKNYVKHDYEEDADREDYEYEETKTVTEEPLKMQERLSSQHDDIIDGSYPEGNNLEDFSPNH